MAQEVWHKTDIARIAAGGVAIAPGRDFALGVAWLAAQLGAVVRVPERPAAVVVVIDGNGREVEL